MRSINRCCLHSDRSWPSYPNVSIVHGDILQIDPTKLLSHYLTNELTRYKVVANIPYYITSAIIRHLLEAPIKPGTIVLTVQQEVAQRIIAQPDDMNLLAVSVQFYGTPRIVQRVKAGAFYPAPDVDSAVVRIDLPDEPLYAVDDVDLFFRVAKAGFGQKRKQLHNALRAGLSLPGEQIDAMLTCCGDRSEAKGRNTITARVGEVGGRG